MFSGRDHQSWSDDDSRYKEYAESSRRYSTSSHLEESGRRQQRLSPTYRHRRGSDRSFSSWSHDSFSEDNSHRSHGPSPSVASNSNRARFQSDGRKRRSKKTRRERKRRGMPKKKKSRRTFVLQAVLIILAFLICGSVVYRKFIMGILFGTEEMNASTSETSPKPSPENTNIFSSGVPSIQYRESLSPSVTPTESTRKPSLVSSEVPSDGRKPSDSPSFLPSIFPSLSPSIQISERPTWSIEPSSIPSKVPSFLPSSLPSQGPLNLLITEIADPYGTPQWYPFIEFYSPNRRGYTIETVGYFNIEQKQRILP